jgi:hypothetical protein
MSDAASSLAGRQRKALRELPEGYQVSHVFDFSKGVWFWVVNVVGIPVAFLVGWLFLQLAAFLRSEDAGQLLATSRQALSWLLALALVAVALVVHELIHGLAFWLFTRSRPRFGFKLYAAYAGAPDWYLPRSQHLVVGIAPFVVLTAIGLVLLPLVSSAHVHLVLLPAAFNAMGAVGDLAVALYEMTQPPGTLVNDTGMVITLYGAAKERRALPEIGMGE